MIQHLHIKNFAIISDLEIHFRKGLTVITGETGSGKSIIMEALHIGTGGKGNRTHVLNGAERSLIEVSINKDDIRRVIYNSGRTKSFINDEPVSESNFLERMGKSIDFHGQHDQQYILNTQSHIHYLDRFAGIQQHSDRLKENFDELRAVKSKLNQLIVRQKHAKEKQELQQYQHQEILAANLQSGEDVTLEKEVITLRHFDELMQTTQATNHQLLEADQSVVNQLSKVRKSLEKLQRIDDVFAPFLKEIETTIVSVQDSSSSMIQYVNSLDHDPQRLSEIEERISVLDSLKRKYGGSLDAVIQKGDELNRASQSSVQLDDDIQLLLTNIAELEAEFQKLANVLHNKRVETIPKLAKSMAREMELLNMPGAVFEIKIRQKLDETSFVILNGDPVAINESGYDTVEFYLSANPGIPPKPLAKIASGGEVSRIMLAMKTVFNQSDPIECLVFDEIDTGISGYTAIKVAENLKTIAKNRQVLCITHLPQIASVADHHIHIEKTQSKGKPIVTGQYLDGLKRNEILKSLTGNT
ncbi:MAG: DNA repair protein RecN [Candidatus Marinimicrobia bacterium]|nr:DNA repair protein RecN [Candidatus Neomarinimicrobiota bacterium]